MTDNLKIAIQNLYRTFSNYGLRPDIESCPCCVTEIANQQLKRKLLNQLSIDDILHYFHKAMTTWGNLNDFKHFLPRIFELYIIDSDELDTLEAHWIFSKLDYGEWKTWGVQEQEAVKTFLLNWWTNSTLTEKEFQGDNITYFSNALNEIQPLLDSWIIDIQKDSFRNLVHYVYYTFQAYKIEKHQDNEIWKTLRSWLCKQADKLEQGFYYYEQSDPNFAQTISYCYDIVQWKR